MIKGKTIIELKDVHSGEVEVIEEENMVTNALQHILNVGHSQNLPTNCNYSIPVFHYTKFMLLYQTNFLLICRFAEQKLHKSNICNSFSKMQNTKDHIAKKMKINAIYFIKKYGVDDHMKHIGCNKSFYMEHLYGIAYFINMVDRDKGKKYLAQLDEIIWV